MGEIGPFSVDWVALLSSSCCTVPTILFPIVFPVFLFPWCLHVCQYKVVLPYFGAGAGGLHASALLNCRDSDIDHNDVHCPYGCESFFFCDPINAGGGNGAYLVREFGLSIKAGEDGESVLKS